MKKGLLIAIMFLSYAFSVEAAVQYNPLTPDFPKINLAESGSDFSSAINSGIKLVIGLTGILAVLMIVYGGILYVSTDSWSGKDSGKKRIQAAVGGLVLALSSYLILNTIDPSLTYLNFTRGLDQIDLAEPLAVIVASTTDSTANYDLNESGSLDPTGATGSPAGQVPAGTTNLDTCEGLSNYRSQGQVIASDKGGTRGGVVGEVAWLIAVIPQKWPGLQVMSSYRSLEWNLESAYGVTDDARKAQIVADFNASDGSYSARVSIAAKYGLPRAALTSNHVLGKAVDFAGPGLSSGQGDALAAWARSNSCLRFSEVLWKTSGHYDHVHLGV